MIVDFLLEHRWMTPTAFVIILAGGPVLGVWLLDRQRFARLLFGLSMVPVLAGTLVPGPRNITERCVAEWSVPTFPRVELAANVVLFMVPALLLAVMTRKVWLGFVVMSAVSAVIEGIQALILAIGRSCSTNDWLSNTIGAAIGALLAAVSMVVERRLRKRVAQP